MFNKKPVEELPEENTQIWSCTNDSCNGWMRANFVFESDPACRLCSSPMVMETKMLPLLINSTIDAISMKKTAEN